VATGHVERDGWPSDAGPAGCPSEPAYSLRPHGLAMVALGLQTVGMRWLSVLVGGHNSGFRTRTKMNNELDDVVASVRAGGRIAPHVVSLDAETANRFLAMRTDPRRFTPAIFVGDWADTDTPACPGEMTIVAAIPCADDVVRVMGRQRGRLFAVTFESDRPGSKDRSRKRARR
jgi:hypothetical protein